jgi:hypothetical protein
VCRNAAHAGAAPVAETSPTCATFTVPCHDWYSVHVHSPYAAWRQTKMLSIRKRLGETVVDNTVFWGYFLVILSLTWFLAMM